MKIHVSELSGSALDWAVAYGLNGEKVFFEAFGSRMLGRSISEETLNGEIRPSTDWSQCGPLLEDSCTALNRSEYGAWWSHSGNHIGEGIDPMAAICRAIVASKLGEYVDIPDELLEVE
jgi:hypothetical protein